MLRIRLHASPPARRRCIGQRTAPSASAPAGEPADEGCPPRGCAGPRPSLTPTQTPAQARAARHGSVAGCVLSVVARCVSGRQQSPKPTQTHAPGCNAVGRLNEFLRDSAWMGADRVGSRAAAVGGSRMHARAQQNVAAYDRITSPRSSTSTAARSGDAATCCGSVRHVATCCNTLQRIPSLRSSIGTAELSSRRSDAGARWWQSGQRRTCTVIVTPAPASRARACATASSAAKEPFPVSARRTTESPVRKPASLAAAASSDAELRARVA